MKLIGKDRLGFLLHDATRLLRKRFETRASGIGLSTSQWRLLVNVLRLGGATQARLAERLEIEPISVSRLIDRMEKAGWLRREQDPTDRRAKRVVPTEKTLLIFEDARAQAVETYSEALAGFTEGEKTLLIAFLDRIVANLADPDDLDATGACGAEPKDTP